MHNTEHKFRQDKQMDQPAHDLQQVDLPDSLTMTRLQRRSPRQIFLVGGIILLLAVVSTSFLFTSWYQSRGLPTSAAQEHKPTTMPTSISKSKTRVIPAPTGKPIDSPFVADHNLSTSIINGVAYISTADNSVYALRTSTGGILWHTSIEGSASSFETPLVVNGVVYLNTYNSPNGPGRLYALRASDGMVLWKYIGSTASAGSTDPNNYIYRPVMENGVLYLSAQDSGLLALNASSGAVLWHYPVKGNVYNAPFIVNGIVYISSSDDSQQTTCYALRMSDGTLLWQRQLSNASILSVENGQIYLGSGDTLMLLRTSNGQQIWSQKIDSTFLQSVQLVDGVIYLSATKILPPASNTQGSTSLSSIADIGALLWHNVQTTSSSQMQPLKEGVSSVYALNDSNGAVLWHYTLNNGVNAWANWLTVQQGVAYVGVSDASTNANKAYVYALQSKNGSVLWQDEIPVSSSSAIVQNSIIYLNGSLEQMSGGVYALRSNDGSLQWSYPLSGTTFTAPILVDTTLYVSAANAMIYALQANDGTLIWHHFADAGR